jgi:hypothetical protein
MNRFGPLIVLPVMLFVGCAENSVKSENENPVRLVKILDQVNDAIQAARQINNNKAPQIESVELDLQLGTANSVNGNFPINFVTPQAEVDHEATHKISLTFAPKVQGNAPLAEKGKMSELAATISAINEAVVQADPKYQFQRGSIKIQCTFSTQLGADAQIGQLVPIGLGVSHSKETIQTITLNFSPQGAPPAPVAAPTADDPAAATNSPSPGFFSKPSSPPNNSSQRKSAP